MAEKQKKFYWLKLSRDFLKRHDIKIIKAMENGKDYIIFYLALLLESIDHEGHLRFSETIPYDEKMLSIVTDTNIDIVKSAINIFKQLGLMEILDDRTIYMTETQKMLGAETEWAKKKREYRKSIAENSKTLIGHKKDNVRQEIEIDKEIDKEIEIDNYMSVVTDNPNTAPIDFNSILQYWNKYSLLKDITTIANKRKDHLNARIKEHGLDAIYKAIDNTAQSSFMRGANKQGWMATFDWVFLPNNFVKVLEGNYLDKKQNPHDEINQRAQKVKDDLGIKDFMEECMQ